MHNSSSHIPDELVVASLLVMPVLSLCLSPLHLISELVLSLGTLATASVLIITQLKP